MRRGHLLISPSGGDRQKVTLGPANTFKGSRMFLPECPLLAQRRGPGGAGSLLELDEEPTYRWGDRLSEDDP